MFKIGIATVALLLATTAMAQDDYHWTFIQIGKQLQLNYLCHNGGPIRLADYSLSEDEAQFAYHNPDMAHRWAMEGVQMVTHCGPY